VSDDGAEEGLTVVGLHSDADDVAGVLPMEGLDADDQKRGQMSTRTATLFTDAAVNVAMAASTSTPGQDEGQC
jgi:hypothetical protein